MTNQQDMPDKQQLRLDAFNNFDRLMAQTKTAILILTMNDNFKCMRDEDISNALWLIGDRVDDLQQAYESLADTLTET